MHCVNHPEVDAQSFCQNCGKPLCSNCVRTTANGQVLCEPCFTATGGNPGQAYWQPPANFAVPPPGAPNPAAAAVLGLIPGVGAMYNGQLFKGLIHVVIFAVLVSITDHYGVFGILIGAWVLYQSFEAFQTAKAKRDGLPLPDPFGLNELGGWLNIGSSGRGFGAHHGTTAGSPTPSPQSPNPAPGTPYTASVPGTSQGTAPSAASAAVPPPPYTAPYAGGWQDQYPPADYPPPGYVPPGYVPTGYPPVQPPYTEPYAGQPYVGGVPPVNPDPYGSGFIPPMPPMPPMPPSPFGVRGKEPVWAFILIGLGLIFLLHTMGFVGHFMRYLWPLMLIGLGAWLVVHRTGNTRGGSK